MSHGLQQSVLLIEADASLRRLITLGLQYRGMHVIEANSPSNFPPIEAQQPDLLILDVDARVSSDWSLLTAVHAHPYLSSLPIVVLAWECMVPAGVASGQQNKTQITCLTKPFDARALHATIDRLLLPDTLPAKQEMLLAAQTAVPSPSIWPLVTAVGLLLACIGLMGILAITVLGLFIVVVSLLWWTLGTNTKKKQASIPVGVCKAG